MSVKAHSSHHVRAVAEKLGGDMFDTWDATEDAQDMLRRYAELMEVLEVDGYVFMVPLKEKDA